MTAKLFESFLEDSFQDRIRVRLLIHKGTLMDFMYQYEALIDDQWTPVIRFDCAHGFFHKDTLYPNGDKEKQKIEIDSLNTAALYAKQDIKERWRWYRERYIKNIKIK